MTGRTSGGTGQGNGAGQVGGRRGDDSGSLSDGELRGILDAMSQVMEKAFDRLDDQTRALDKLTVAIESLQAKPDSADPQRVAQVTAQGVRDTLLPHLVKIVSAMEELNGGKALLRERLRAMDREEARHGRWRFHPAAVVVGIPLALVLLLALAVPRAVAQTAVTCRATGGTWYEASERYPAACLFSKEEGE